MDKVCPECKIEIQPHEKERPSGFKKRKFCSIKCSTIFSRKKRLIDLTGKRFGKWVVIEKLNTDRYTWWNCQCDCGNIFPVRGMTLNSGDSKQCKLCHHQMWKEVRPTNITHGRSKTREYIVWRHMKERCGKPSDPNYHNYGGRGITVCTAWNASFETFFEDMGLCEGLLLERIDNDKGYFKENCKWATWDEQANNRRPWNVNRRK